jgi:GcrA cell cycle regulator
VRSSNRGEFLWDEAAIERLKELWADGYSGSEVAERMGEGLTRCAILGKVHRLGLRRGPRMKVARLLVKKPPKKVAPREVSRPEMPPMRPDLRPPEPTAPGTLSLLDLRPGQCHWPTGDSVPYTFCAAPQEAGSSYCEIHHRMSVWPVPLRAAPAVPRFQSSDGTDWLFRGEQ